MDMGTCIHLCTDILTESSIRIFKHFFLLLIFVYIITFKVGKFTVTYYKISAVLEASNKFKISGVFEGDSLYMHLENLTITNHTDILHNFTSDLDIIFVVKIILNK